jgi:hypothetical protein
MNWLKPADPYHQYSEDGRYSVCRIGFNGGAFYETWRTRKHEDGPHLVITNLPTSADARVAAEADDQDCREGVP